MSKKLLFIPLILFIGLVVMFTIQLVDNADGDDPTKLESVLVGKPVPAFRLPNLFDEHQYYDQRLFQGKPMLLNVWATWCPTCHAEHQFLNTLAHQGVNIVGLNYKDDRANAIAWLNHASNPYAVNLFDRDGMYGLDLGVYGAPETFVIDGQGVIRYRHIGDVNAQNWQMKLEPLYHQLVRETRS